MQNNQTELTGMPEPVEQILTLPADRFTRFRHNHFITGHEAAWMYDMIQHDGTFRERTDELEKNVLFRQPIVYVVVQNYDGRYLLFKRKPKQVEQRLVNRYGVGIGGHINPCDFTVASLDRQLEHAARRELYEEVKIVIGSLLFAGIVIENQTEIGRVHVGAVFHMVTNSDFEHAEADKQDTRWADVEELFDCLSDMEIWSQQIVGHYICGRKRPGF